MDTPTSSNWVPAVGTRVQVIDDRDAGFTGTVRPDTEATFDAGNTHRPCAWVVLDTPITGDGIDPPITGLWYPTYRLVPIAQFQIGDRVNRTDVSLWGDPPSDEPHVTYVGEVISAETLCVEVQDEQGSRRYLPVKSLELVAPPTFAVGDRVNKALGDRCDQFGFVLGFEGVAVRVGWSNGDDVRHHPNALVKVEDGQPLTFNARIAAGVGSR